MADISDPITAEIVRGAAADALLADAAFCAEWASLCAACPWATPFQAPGFARTWYSVYRCRWEPLLVLSRNSMGALQGLLPLAMSTPGRALVLAGGHQAEYQTWIALPDVGDAFIWAAIQRLRLAMPSTSLSFRYLPPASPRAWLDHPIAARTCLLRTQRRPLMMFGDGSDIRASLAKRSNKSRLKRFNKIGNVTFKQLSEPRELEAMIDDVTLFYDARRMAVNGAAPFADDPLKRPFHIAMMKVPGLLHTTALMCGDRIASFQLNTIDAKHVQLSLITHSPLLAEHSPGKFHVLMLGKLLMEQGYEWIDLTPGGDPYKERFANCWDEVYTLEVLGGAIQRRAAALIHSVANHTKQSLARWEIRPAYAKAVARRIVSPSGLLHLARQWLGASQQGLIYARDTSPRQLHEPKQLIRRDAIDDLMAYQPANGGATRHEFLSDAMRRLENGQRAYTCAEDGRLLHYAWFASEPPKELAASALPGFPWPEKCGLVVDCYTFPPARGRGLGFASLATMLKDATATGDLKQTFIAIPAASAAARRLVERVGFAFERPCVRRFVEL